MFIMHRPPPIIARRGLDPQPDLSSHSTKTRVTDNVALFRRRLRRHRLIANILDQCKRCADL
jgi:hypothetical protein